MRARYVILLIIDSVKTVSSQTIQVMSDHKRTIGNIWEASDGFHTTAGLACVISPSL